MLGFKSFSDCRDSLFDVAHTDETTPKLGCIKKIGLHTLHASEDRLDVLPFPPPRISSSHRTYFIFCQISGFSFCITPLARSNACLNLRNCSLFMLPSCLTSLSSVCKYLQFTENRSRLISMSFRFARDHSMLVIGVERPDFPGVLSGPVL